MHVHITNYQDRYYGGAAMIRLYSFDLVRGVIDVETFSPWFLHKDPEQRSPLEAETVELTGPADRFSLAIPFTQRVGSPFGVSFVHVAPASLVFQRKPVSVPA